MQKWCFRELQYRLKLIEVATGCRGHVNQDAAGKSNEAIHRRRRIRGRAHARMHARTVSCLFTKTPL